VPNGWSEFFNVNDASEEVAFTYELILADT